MPLTPSQRLTSMKEIARRLDAEDWPLIDATLKQFSSPYSDTWNNPSKSGYVIAMIEQVADQSLIDLAHHTGFYYEETSTPRIEPSFWRKGMFRVFVSHLSAHKAFATELQQALLLFGITGFVAHKDMSQHWNGKSKLKRLLLQATH